jgi:hypothetical protein
MRTGIQDRDIIMPALNFQKQFAPKVESGEKRQTIRAERKNPIKRNDHLYLYTGMRTKSCRKLRDATCVNVEPVEILENGVMTLSGIVLNRKMKDVIAIKDGFENWNEMWLWFKNTHGFPFKGQLITWW